MFTRVRVRLWRSPCLPNGTRVLDSPRRLRASLRRWSIADSAQRTLAPRARNALGSVGERRGRWEVDANPQELLQSSRTCGQRSPGDGSLLTVRFIGRSRATPRRERTRSRTLRIIVHDERTRISKEACPSLRSFFRSRTRRGTARPLCRGCIVGDHVGGYSRERVRTSSSFGSASGRSAHRIARVMPRMQRRVPREGRFSRTGRLTPSAFFPTRSPHLINRACARPDRHQESARNVSSLSRGPANAEVIALRAMMSSPIPKRSVKIPTTVFPRTKVAHQRLRNMTTDVFLRQASREAVTMRASPQTNVSRRPIPTARAPDAAKDGAEHRVAGTSPRDQPAKSAEGSLQIARHPRVPDGQSRIPLSTRFRPRAPDSGLGAPTALRKLRCVRPHALDNGHVRLVHPTASSPDGPRSRQQDAPSIASGAFRRKLRHDPRRNRPTSHLVESSSRSRRSTALAASHRVAL